MEGDRWNESIDDLKAFIKNRLKTSLCDSDESKDMLLSSVVTKASMQIMKNVCRMVNQEIRNEAELRFCIGDPILCAICNAWKYRAKLEESVKNQTKLSAALQSASLSAAPSTSTSMAATQLKATPLGLHLQSGVITDQSKADYTVYVIRSEDGDIISVVIETKHTSNSAINHAVAQVIGYFAAFDITVQTSLVFILTEIYVQMVFFPFESAEEQPLINAIVLPPMEVFTEDGEPSTVLLQLLVSLSKSYASTAYVKMPTGRSKTMSRTVFSAHVQTDSQKMAAVAEENLQLKQKLEQKQQKLEQNQREFEVFLTKNPDIKRKFEASKASD